MKFWAGILICFALAAQENNTKLTEAEDKALRTALQDNASSTVDLMRAIETHLAKYPKSPKRPELERALLQGAVELKDWKRVALYGERVIQTGQAEPQVLDNTAHALMDTDPASADRVLSYGTQLEAIVSRELSGPLEGRDGSRKRDSLERALSRSLQYQSWALAHKGERDRALEFARKAYIAYSGAEEARFLGNTLADAGNKDEAIRYWAEAFAMTDSRFSESDRAAVRTKMGEVYRAAKGTEAGLGDEILRAYDRVTKLAEQKRAQMRLLDPNSGISDPMDFTLVGLKGEPMKLSSLKGKVVIMDFWATWCGPCRAQYPLYEEVKKRFKDRSDVVFLGINTDEDRTVVAPFLEQQKWTGKSVYFENGLQRLLRVSSIPTTIIFDQRGQLASRMDGFLPDRFVDQLTDRISSLLKPQNAMK